MRKNNWKKADITMPKAKYLSRYHLTPSEESIMLVLWDSKISLSQLQIISIVQECGKLTWKERSIFSMLNSLMDKGLIEPDGFIRSGKTYARTFRAAVSRAEFCADFVLSFLSEEELPKFEQAMREKRRT